MTRSSPTSQPLPLRNSLKEIASLLSQQQRCLTDDTVLYTMFGEAIDMPTLKRITARGDTPSVSTATRTQASSPT